jgi:hypothetical protein
MFVTLAPRLATSFAITVGTVAGGMLALMHTPPPADLAPEAPRLEPARAPASTPMPSAVVRVPARAPAPAAASVPARPSEASRDLTPSPHDSPLPTEAELRKSERLCIRDLPDECVRAADAFLAGAVVEQDKRRAAQYSNLAFNGYIRACEKNHPEACYALARIYLHGDGVPANPAYAKNLMRRVVEVCRYKKAAICQRLVQEAPMPPKAKHR